MHNTTDGGNKNTEGEKRYRKKHGGGKRNKIGLHKLSGVYMSGCISS